MTEFQTQARICPKCHDDHFEGDRCSALIGTDANAKCQHGHWINGACRGVPGVVPFCVDESRKFDERLGIVTPMPWRGI